MTKTVYWTATTVDGFIADENDSLDWLFEAEREGTNGFDEFFGGVGAMCMGATTYSWVLDHEQALAHPEKWTRFYGDTPCWVFTHRDLPAVPGVPVTVTSGDVAPAHAAMVAAAGGRDVWVVGGGDLAGQFADRGLLDEVVINVAPAFLGGGAPLLPRQLRPSRVTLAEVRQLRQFAQLRYRLRSEPAG